MKFQLIYPEGLYVEYLLDEQGERKPNPVVAERRRQQLADEEWEDLAAYARDRAIEFSASVFDERGVALLARIGVPYLKIASTDLNNGNLLASASESGLDLIVSTGMSSLSEIREAAEILGKHRSLDRTTFLHCVSEYPCPEDHVGLAFLEVLREELGRPVGFSDHTLGTGAGVAAVALGATVVEKHLTHDRSAPGFDHHYALEEDGLTAFIRACREAAQAIQPKSEKLSSAELQVAARARRGLYAARNVKAGERLAESDVLIVRPPAPFAPNDCQRLVGLQVMKPIEAFQPLTPAHFE